MKYLYLIIRHFFPRRKWRVIERATLTYGNQPIGTLFTLQDQFGNIKTKKVN